jgi:hypothetical protein
VRVAISVLRAALHQFGDKGEEDMSCGVAAVQFHVGEGLSVRREVSWCWWYASSGYRPRTPKELEMSVARPQHIPLMILHALDQVTFV